MPALVAGLLFVAGLPFNINNLFCCLFVFQTTTRKKQFPLFRGGPKREVRAGNFGFRKDESLVPKLVDIAGKKRELGVDSLIAWEGLGRSKNSRYFRGSFDKSQDCCLYPNRWFVSLHHRAWRTRERDTRGLQQLLGKVVFLLGSLGGVHVLQFHPCPLAGPVPASCFAHAKGMAL